MNCTEKTGAKINLSLKITGKRGGMHTLVSRVCSVGLYDEVELTERRGGGVFSFAETPDGFSAEMYLPRLMRAYGILSRAVDFSSCAFRIVKRIPPGAGLGGSSAVTAAMARLAARLRGAAIPAEMLRELGSDVPYMYVGGEAEISGAGETVKALPFEERSFVIAFPDGGVDTASAFALYDEEGGGGVNDLYAAACRLNASVGRTAELLRARGAENVFMTGSGSAVCAEFARKDYAELFYEKIKNETVCVKVCTIPAYGGFQQ